MKVDIFNMFTFLIIEFRLQTTFVSSQCYSDMKSRGENVYNRIQITNNVYNPVASKILEFVGAYAN